ncbi:MAG TPA: methyltransferase domain-containing protein [Spirochaetia bacterium]|nr:methyltransferase domain-containing protein [Spirochaetia bacterium]
MKRTRSARSYLLVPAGGGGEGMGHLSRCIRLAGRLGGRVTLLASRLNAASRALLREAAGRAGRKARPKLSSGLPPGARWDLIVLDGRRTSHEDLALLQRRGPVVCLDEGGEARDYSSYLVDTLPGPPGRGAANVSSPEYLDLPPRARKRPPAAFRRVLLSFGGEDRENLTEKLLDALVADGLFAPSQITIVEGPLFRTRRWLPGIRVLRRVSKLPPILSHHDLVFTHFGMTCFESLAIGVPVILFNPSSYHALLSRAAGIPDIGVQAPDLASLRRLLDDPGTLKAPVEDLNARIGAQRAGRLSAHLRMLFPRGTPGCPVCGRDGNKVIARFPDRTYRACTGCGTMYMESFSANPPRYDASYFSTEYRAQYGRTYLEDFESIKAVSRQRLSTLRKIAGERAEGAVVDVGCAYGPFLAAAQESGLPCFGIDVAADAVNHVKRKLGIPALCASFESVQRRLLPRRISAVTMWWVIEHFPDTDLVLRKASALLPPGGVLAFSTPNGRGVSARRNLGLFLEKSPSDHYTIFSPRGLRRLLANYGLELRHVSVTGHHADRFPGILGRAAAASAAVSSVVAAASRALGLGDTFEAYAVKGDQS